MLIGDDKPLQFVSLTQENKMSVVVTYEQFEFMDMVREHDNPMGATPDLMTCFDLSRSEASKVLSAWMSTYSSLDDSSHTTESRQARVDKANANREDK